MTTNTDNLLDVYPHTVPITLVKGQGARVFDSDGKEYLDFASGMGVNMLGYGNKEIIEAAKRQLDKIIHVSNLYYNTPQLELCQVLASLSGLDRVFLSNSGAEANECAIKIAKKWAGVRGIEQPEIICFDKGWHGRTLGTISACANDVLRGGYDPLLPGFVSVKAFNLDEVHSNVNEMTVAIILEPTLGHGGIRPAPQGFLRELRSLCDNHGMLMILDEIQTGLGRTGSLFQYQAEQILPDILTLAKGLAAGFPIGATVCTKVLADAMPVNSHGTTFGGNPVVAEVAKVVLAQVSDPLFLKNVSEKGKVLESKLNQLKQKFPTLIQSTRSLGLMAALDLTICRSEVLTEFARVGFLASGVGSNCVRFLPPLSISIQDIEEAFEKMGRVFTGFIRENQAVGF